MPKAITVLELSSDEKDISNITDNIYTSIEKQLINDYWELSEQGQEYILQTMNLAKSRYKKSNSNADMEEIS